MVGRNFESGCYSATRSLFGPSHVKGGLWLVWRKGVRLLRNVIGETAHISIVFVDGQSYGKFQQIVTLV